MGTGTAAHHADYEIVIRPQERMGLARHLAEIWEARDLVTIFVYREFVTRFKQTILGPAWSVIQPLMLTAMFVIVFSRIGQIPTDGVHPILFYLCSLMLWTYTSQTFDQSAVFLISARPLTSKVYFPRLAIPLAFGISKMINLSIQLGIFVCFLLWFLLFVPGGGGAQPNWTILLFPLLVLQCLFVGLGFGVFISAVTVKYRDLLSVMALLVQLWMYATPIVYPASRIPERYQFLMYLNPMAAIIENSRHMFLGTGSFRWDQTLVSVAISVVLFVAGVSTFTRVERTHIDVL